MSDTCNESNNTKTLHFYSVIYYDAKMSIENYAIVMEVDY